MTKPAQVTPYPLRMPDDLRRRLEGSADSIGRSLNAEIVDRLERSFHGTHIAGLSVEDVMKVTDHVIKTLYTDYVPRASVEAAPAAPAPRSRRAPGKPKL